MAGGGSVKEKKLHGVVLHCMGCKRFFREEKLIHAPDGMYCQNCIKEEELEEKISPKVGYFGNEEDCDE